MVWMSTNETAEVALEGLISSFSLVVHLRVMGGGHLQLGSRGSEHTLPECTGEHRVTIRYHGLW
jgi:hypothetical protein